MSEKEIEKIIEEKNLNAPRITSEHVESVVVDEYYHVIPLTTMTICALTLENGFIVTGESAAASIENFDREAGMTVARGKAIEKIWQLEGYLLKQKLYEEKK